VFPSSKNASADADVVRTKTAKAIPMKLVGTAKEVILKIEVDAFAIGCSILATPRLRPWPSLLEELLAIQIRSANRSNHWREHSNESRSHRPSLGRGAIMLLLSSTEILKNLMPN
jgi:hypothetical protein